MAVTGMTSYSAKRTHLAMTFMAVMATIYWTLTLGCPEALGAKVMTTLFLGMLKI